MSSMSMRNTHGIMAIGGQHRAEICCYNTLHELK
jgi:hypothetical protein